MKLNSRFILWCIACLFMLAPSIQCCKKYEDGPLLSMKTRKERLANTWQVKTCFIDGKDSTALYSGYHETFTKGGNYYYSGKNCSGSGTWAFCEKDSQINLTGEKNCTLVITKLDEKELWYYYYENGVEKEFRMTGE